MIEWLTRLFDNRTFMRINAVFGFLFLVFFYSSIFRKREKMKEDEGWSLRLR